MKKIVLFVAIIMALVGFSALKAFADEIIPKDTTSMALLLGSYCTKGQVQYTEWSSCDKRFGKNGYQWRNIIYPTFNGCKPSVYDQVNTVRECLD